MRSRLRKFTPVLILPRLLGRAIVVLVILPTALLAQNHTIEYKFEKGQAYDYELSQQSEQVVEFMGSVQKMSSDSRIGFRASFDRVNEVGHVVYTMTITAFALEFKNALIDTSIENPAELIGLKLSKEMKRNGDQVSAVRVGDGPEIPDLVAQFFSANSEFFPNIPEGKLQQGNVVTFTDVDTVSGAGRNVISTTDMEYTLEGESTKDGYQCLRIRYEGLVTATGSGVMQGTLSFDLEGDGEIEGVLYFAPKEGIVVSDDRTARLELTAKITSPQTMTLPITQTEKRILTLSK